MGTCPLILSPQLVSALEACLPESRSLGLLTLYGLLSNSSATNPFHRSGANFRCLSDQLLKQLLESVPFHRSKLDYVAVVEWGILTWLSFLAKLLTGKPRHVRTPARTPTQEHKIGEEIQFFCPFKWPPCLSYYFQTTEWRHPLERVAASASAGEIRSRISRLWENFVRAFVRVGLFNSCQFSLGQPARRVLTREFEGVRFGFSLSV